MPKAQAAEVVGLPLGELEDGDVAYMPLRLVPLQEAAEARQANRDALAEARDARNEPNNDRRNGNGQNAEEDEREEASLPIVFDVKKNSQKQTRSGSGKQQTQLVGTTSAASRLAQKARWKKTSEKSLAD